MRLLAWSFHNIWPFLDTERTVQFLPWATLIKAPIGTWKSFLFFDGPLFALYKRSQRPMLHRLAKHGQIQIVVSHGWEHWLIIRYLKSTKAGNDSVTTTIFRLSCALETITDLLHNRLGNEIITDGVMIETLFPDEIREPIESTQQKELDNFLATMLPPKEVILSSCVLVQESDNIFEMSPATRIAVFKELFQLLDIDHIREHLADKKRQLQTRRLVLQEDTWLEQSLHLLIEKMQSKITILKQHTHTATEWAINTFLSQPLLHDLVTLPLDEIKTNWRNTQWYDTTIYNTAVHALDTTLQQLLFQQGQIEQTKQQIITSEKRLQELQTQLSEKEKRMQIIDTQLNNLADQSRQTASTTLTQLEWAQNALFERLPLTVATQRWFTRTSLADAEQQCLTQIAETKQHKLHVDTLTQQHTQLKEQEQKALLTLQQYETQIKQLETNAQDADRFHCNKIQWDCPYVMVIKKVSTTALDQQISYLQQQITEITNQLPAFAAQYTQLTEQLQQHTTAIEKATQFFNALNRSAVNELFAQAKQNDQQIRDLQKTLRNHADDATHFRALQEEKQQIALLIQQLVDTATNEKADIAALQKQIVQLETSDNNTWTLQQLKTTQSVLQELHNLIDQATTLGWQVIKRQDEIRELQTNEWLYKDLVNVFQKELLLVVLQDFLPVLENVINEHLSQVAAFQLRFELPKTMQEQIELNIWIDDIHGARAVKSLSGGQKALLRLCRILAVSALFNQEFLLLDETINSLDHEAIGRVAQLLDSYVKKRDISFYLVTHAPQIQEMDFWRRIIELRSL